MSEETQSVGAAHPGPTLAGAGAFALFEELFKHSPVAFQIYREDGRSLLVNDAFRRLFGAEPPPEYVVFEDEVLAKEGFLDLVRRAFGGETVRVPSHWYDPRELRQVEIAGGRRVGIEATLFPLADGAGAVRHVAVCFKDVTAQLEFEQERNQLRETTGALERSRQEMAAILDSVGDAVVAADRSRRVTRMNRVAEVLTGWTSRDAEGRDLGDVVRLRAGDARGALDAPVRRAFDEGRVTPWPDTSVLVSRDGTERPVSGRVGPICNADGQTYASVLVLRDQTEERRADRALRQSEQRSRRLIESATVGVLVLDVDGKTAFMNDRLARILGTTPDEALRIPVTSFVPTELRPAAAEELARRRQGAHNSYEQRFLRRDGAEGWAVIESGPLYDLDGRFDGVLATVMDITERRKAEEALRRSDARFRRLADSGIIGIMSGIVHGDVLEANDAFLKMVGYTREELLARKVRSADLTPPEWVALDARATEQFRAAGVVPAREKEYVRKDGTRVPVLVGVTRVEGESAEWIAFVLDQTDRKRAEALLRESDARKTAVMEAALDAIVMMDHRGEITEFNPAAESMFGYSSAEAIGKPLAELLIPSSLRARHASGLTRYLVTEEARVVGKRVEVPALRRDGSEFPAEVAVVRIRGSGAPMFTGYIRDITERVRAAEAEMLRRAKEAAEEANTELESFSYSVAHDLRAPLRAIHGFASLLAMDYGPKLDGEAHDYLARITSGAERMAELIDALLSLAGLARAEPRRQTVDLSRLARHTVEQLRVRDPSRSVEFLVADGLLAEGDPLLLAALLENLLANAWKFTRRRSPARIEFGRELVDGEVAYFVRDNGSGFDMALAHKLFTPFLRLHSNAEFEGNGIGLATVQRIVRRHGGRIWGEGAVDRGATFRFVLSAGSPSTRPR